MRLTNTWLYIANPRTASSSIQKCLKDGDYGRENHSKLYELQYVPNFEQLFKFTFIRNPFDYFVSHFNWMKPETFKRHMLGTVKEDKAQYHYSCINGQLAVDFLGKFENLVEDFSEICAKIGRKCTLPHINKTEHLHYKDMYDKELTDYVRDVFHLDFEIGEYA